MDSAARQIKAYTLQISGICSRVMNNQCPIEEGLAQCTKFAVDIDKQVDMMTSTHTEVVGLMKDQSRKLCRTNAKLCKDNWSLRREVADVTEKVKQITDEQSQDTTSEEDTVKTTVKELLDDMLSKICSQEMEEDDLDESALLYSLSQAEDSFLNDSVPPDTSTPIKK